MASSNSNHDFDDELLSAYVDNELTAQERTAVEELLRTNERARQTVADLRAASEAVKSLPRVGLGRDLRSSVFAAIDRLERAEISAEPAILTMPVRDDHERRTRGFRPLIWAGFAVAAALLLMMVLPGQLQDQRHVAVKSGDAANKKIESAETDHSTTAFSEDSVGKGVPADGEGLTRSTAASPKIGAFAGDARQSRGISEPAVGRPEDAPARSGLESAGGTASPMFAAAEPASGNSNEKIDDAGAEGGAADSTSGRTLLRTYELTIADDAGSAAFQQQLSDLQIKIADGEPPAELSASLPMMRFERLTEETRDNAAAAAPAPAEAVLVEAMPGEIDALVASLQRDPAKFKSFQQVDPATGAITELAAGGPRGAAEAESTRAGGGGQIRGGLGGGGFGGGGRFADRGGRAADGVETTASRAWRLSLSKEQSNQQPNAVRLRGAATTPPPAAAPAAAPQSAGELSDASSRPDDGRVRVLFLLRRAK